jgi:hypothetical protein
LRTKGTLALINISAKKIDWEFGLIVTYATFETLAFKDNKYFGLAFVSMMPK